MNRSHDYYPDCPEALIVNLARGGDRMAFSELVRRHQSNMRNFMRRCCKDNHLADDLAQQVFLKVWLNIRSLREAKAFAGWLKKIAVSVWLQHLRKQDVLFDSAEFDDVYWNEQPTPGIGMDLDVALATLPESVRLCVILSYQEGMSHQEIVEATELPLGTIKSHIRRGSERLKKLLSAYSNNQQNSGDNSQRSESND